MQGRVLIIAGSDSGGGAGIQADIKTVTVLGGYAATAITAVTVQNTLGVSAIHDVPDAIIAAQIEAVLSDIGADAIKTGMLHKASVIHAVADALAPYPDIPLILDPVMVAKGGAPLLQQEAVAALKERLIPRALLITPNVPEAEALLQVAGCTLQDADKKQMAEAAQKLLTLGSRAVFLKGGHLSGSEVTDVLMNTCNLQPETCNYYISPRIDTRHTHGTGCTLASAIAASIAQGMGLQAACARAHDYVHRAILAAPGLGKGHGPLGHLV